MFDPEKVETAETLQRACPQWLIFWSPALREFTAIPLFDTGQLVVINAPATHTLLKEMGVIEMQASVGAMASGPTDVGAQYRTDARSTESPSETDPARPAERLDAANLGDHYPSRRRSADAERSAPSRGHDGRSGPLRAPGLRHLTGTGSPRIDNNHLPE